MSDSKFTKINNAHKAIEEGMEECLKKSDSLSLLTASAEDKGRAFLQFYTQDIAKNLDNWSNFDENVFESCHCDGANDLGIDFVYDHRGPGDQRFWIFQSKYKGPRGGGD